MILAVLTERISLSTKGNTDIIDITSEISQKIRECGLRAGIVNIFICGSTGALTTVEYEPGLKQDLKVLFERLAPKDARYEHDATWNDKNGYSHVRASLLGPSLTVPFVDSEILLGMWQQIVFIDFDNRPRQRSLVLQIIGE
jgi:secondary thiamine-phosphate synthase enzyme